MQYSIELFFNCFSDIKRITIFVYGEYHVLSLDRFKALPNCTFMMLGFEWIKSGNTISKDVLGYSLHGTYSGIKTELKENKL